MGLYGEQYAYEYNKISANNSMAIAPKKDHNFLQKNEQFINFKRPLLHILQPGVSKLFSQWAALTIQKLPGASA